MKQARVRLHRRETVLLIAASILAYGCGGSDDSIKDDISSLVEKGKRESIDRMSSVIEGLSEAVKDPEILMYARNGALPLWVASIFTGSWLGNLDFEALPQNLVSYYRKAGSEYRDLVGAESIWETIPRSIRMGGPKTLKEFHASRDWSHFIPRSLGAGDSGNEGIFEKKILNQIRGAKTMAVEEIAQARNALRVDLVRNAVRLVSKGTVVGSLVTVATEGTFATLENGLLFHEGKISQSELNSSILKQVGSSGGLAIAVSGLALGLSIVFPPLLPVVSYAALPLAFASFVLVGTQFYSLTDEWMERVGFAPLVEVWNELN